MSKQPIKIFIASSAEMNEEREKCILILNQINKSHKHLHLEPIEWEYDLVHGSNPGFETIQKKINPLLEESHLCVFMFYSKIGKYTQEEFELATAKGKKLLAYFKTGFSASTKSEHANQGILIDFKESLNDTVLYKNYNSIDKFELLLKDNLHLYLSEEFPLVTHDIQPLSQETNALLKILAEKQTEIERLKASTNLLANPEDKLRLQQLEQDYQNLQTELSQSKEIIQQQAKDKADLENSLQKYDGNNELKTKAFEEVEKGNYKQAKNYLEESAKEQINKTAEAFYELGKVCKLDLDYKQAHYYFDLAVKINSENEDYLLEASHLSNILGYYNVSIEYLERLINFHIEEDSTKATYYNNLGSSHNSLGKFDIAIKYYELALAIDKQFYKTKYSQVAIYYNNLGEAYKSKGNYKLAIDFLEKSLSIDKEFFGEFDARLATACNNLGLVYSKMGQYDFALEYYKKALAIDIQFYGETHPTIATIYNNLGLVNKNKGNFDLAIDYYEKALKIDNEIYKQSHPNMAIRYDNLGGAYQCMADYNLAVKYHEMALDINKQFFGESHPNIAIGYNNIGEVHRKKGDYDLAIEYFEKALIIDFQFHEKINPNASSIYNNIGLAHVNKGNYDLAIEYYNKSLIINQKFYLESHPSIAIDYNNLGGAYHSKQNYQLAIDFYNKCLNILNQFLDPNHTNILLVQNNLTIAIAARDKQS